MPPLPPPIGVGLLGLGVVGSGVFRALREQARIYAQRTGRRIEVRRIAVRDPQRARGVDVDPSLIVVDPLAIATAPDVDVVIELMGGEVPAGACIRAALAAGKHVVTANKLIMAKHGPELLALAQEHGVELRYEASVGGGVPIIAPLRRDFQANEVQAIEAIINGTTNYMLTAMAQRGVTYADALADAQRLGYAEADPASDVEAVDAAYKIAILASLAFHATVPPDAVYREGITRLRPRDFAYAKEMGYVIKLVATARRCDGALDVRVHPTLLPERDPLAKVDGVLNAVAVEGDLLGRVIFQGQGAGAAPTTSAVLADLLDVVHGVAAGQSPRPLRPADPALPARPMRDLRMRYYLRILVADRPGVLADIGHVFAANGISIATLIQVAADAAAGSAELVITTHEAREADVDRFLAQATTLDAVHEIGVRVRMERAGP